MEQGNKAAIKIDFCKLTRLTPGMLNELLTLTNFTGYTGLIDFTYKYAHVRSYKTFYLYNIKTTINDAVLVGNFSYLGYSLNYSDILLPNGNNSISGTKSLIILQYQHYFTFESFSLGTTES